MPVRLLKAVFGYLNFFSMVYGQGAAAFLRRPRTPALDQDVRPLWAAWRLIELSKIHSDPQYAGNLVPVRGNWCAWPRPVRGPRSSPARGGFDVRADGRVVYSNGYDVIELDEGVRRAHVRQERVAALSATIARPGRRSATAVEWRPARDTPTLARNASIVRGSGRW
jgi:hypothetical protein